MFNARMLDSFQLFLNRPVQVKDRNLLALDLKAHQQLDLDRKAHKVLVLGPKVPALAQHHPLQGRSNLEAFQHNKGKLM